MSDDSAQHRTHTDGAKPANKNSNIWYIRKKDKVTGPFPAGQISQLLVVGRLSLDDEVSHDKDEWFTIHDVPGLIPEVLSEADDASHAERLAAARRWADERREERREENPKTPSRQSNGRRHGESLQDIEYRQHRESIYKNFRERPKMAVAKLLVFVAIVIGLVWGSFNYSPLNIVDIPDCTAQARKGVNWRNCNMLSLVAIRTDISESNLHSAILRNANLFASNFSKSRMDYVDLSGSNLSFAVFNHTNLKGANFKRADLKKTSFTGANLTYADFSNASLSQTNFKDADLSHAIWVEGQKCKQGSIGRCIQ